MKKKQRKEDNQDDIQEDDIKKKDANTRKIQSKVNSEDQSLEFTAKDLNFDQELRGHLLPSMRYN